MSMVRDFTLARDPDRLRDLDRNRGYGARFVVEYRFGAAFCAETDGAGPHVEWRPDGASSFSDIEDAYFWATTRYLNFHSNIGIRIRDEYTGPILFLGRWHSDLPENHFEVYIDSVHPAEPPHPPLDLVWSATPVVLEEKKHMVKIGIKRPNGKLTLEINAKGLHDTLDALGVSHSGNRYADRPTTTFAVANSAFKLSTDALLVREYPAKFDLSSVYNTPASFSQLKKLCESAGEQTRKILDHYQPIDISVEIQKKVLKADNA